ncbi:MAG: ComF family protein [Bacillota bacterium]
MNFFELVLDIIYPRQECCLNCGRTVDHPELEGLCASCLGEIEFVDNYCSVCGREIEKRKDICTFCRQEGRKFDLARAAAVYSGSLRYLLIKLKYYGCREFVPVLAHILEMYYLEYFSNSGIDYIIPVPLSTLRYTERGFNQASLLARWLSQKITPLYREDFLIRKQETVPLFNLGGGERRAAVKGVFAVSGDKNDLKESRVLLIDDIFTTGSTVDEASRVLKCQGRVRKVFVLTLATASLIQ